MTRRLWIVATLIAALALPTIAAAETIVAADFDEGTVKGRLYRNYIGTASYVDARVTDVVDNYSGMGDSGWGNAWQTPYGTSSIRLEVAVRGDGDTGYSELVEDNYLSFRMENSNTSAGGRHAGISRNYAGTGGIDPTKDHTIQFTIRIDEDTAGTGALWDDDNRYTIMDRDVFDGGTSASAASTNSNWAIELRGATNARQWYITHNGSNTLTSITPAQGVAYDFTIDFHPSAGTFDVEIEGANNDSYSGTGFSLRNQSTFTGPRGYLTFGTMAKKKTGTGMPNAVRQFSLDGVAITQVPEPTVLAMALGLLLAGLGLRRRD